MKALLPVIFVILLWGCQTAPLEPEHPDPDPNPPSPSVGTVVPGSGDKPAILEAEVEGIGKATIDGQTIRIKIPAGYTKNTIRLDYKVTEGVKVVIPASGSQLPIRDTPSRTICIQQDQSGNCTLPYQLIIEAPSPITVSVDPATMRMELTEFYQPYEFLFNLSNLKTATAVTRTFQVRLVNKATGYSYTGDNYIAFDRADQLVILNELNGPPVPNDIKLRLTGTLPLGIKAGEYTVTLQVQSCYAPSSSGACSSFGNEYLELPIPLVIKAGSPIVGFINSSPTANRELRITGRNFTPSKTVTVRLTNDFVPATVTRATVQSDTLAKVSLPASLSAGQYHLEVAPDGGKAYRVLFAIPSEKSSASFAYVAPQGQYAANMNWLPTLPILKRGAALEMRYIFTTGNLSPSSLARRTVKFVRLTDTTNRSYDLAAGGSFAPFVAAPEFIMWKWTIPTTIPTGDYTLTFEDFDGTVSLPYYKKIRLE
ncbi:hypothetical protein GCM10027347_06230 [Larkinella harenae]